MKRLRPLTQCAPAAASIAPEVKLTFARDVIDVSIPLFINKNPQTPGTNS